MEQHIKELVGRLGSGQGLPWPKPQYFKKIVSEEKSREEIKPVVSGVASPSHFDTELPSRNLFELSRLPRPISVL